MNTAEPIFHQAEPFTFTTSDHEPLFARHWPAMNPGSVRKAIVLIHRGHEHSGRLQHIVDELGRDDTDFFAWDARGHGRSLGPRGYSPSIGRSVQDVDEFVRHITTTHGIALNNVVVVAQSVGAVLAATWVHDYAPKIQGLVLAAPAFKVKLYVPLARFGIALWQKFKGVFYVNSYVKAKFLTHDPLRIASFNQDPLISRPIASNILLELYSTSERIVKDAAAITLPTQLLIAGEDMVVHQGPQKAFFSRLRHPLKEQHVMGGFYHDVLGEQNRAEAFVKMNAFMDALDHEALAAPFDYTHEDRWSPCADTYRELLAPLPAYSAKGLYYRVFQAAVRTFCQSSNGMKLGLDTGFDSGSTLDYVYQNQPQGKHALGRLIDKNYLNSPGWTGIRQRKVHLEQMIKQVITALAAEDKAVHIVDIAAGHGRYVLDAIEQDERVQSILLRDYSELNVAQGSQMIAQRQLQDKAQFVLGNAFDQADLAAINPKPTLAIVSGLYELFSDNALLQASLAGLFAAVEADGYLIYTNQPWHPQQELIARGLTSHRQGQAWVMRVRSQAEMDDLVAKAGFEKQHQLIDQWGIFSVSIAKRPRTEAA